MRAEPKRKRDAAEPVSADVAVYVYVCVCRLRSWRDVLFYISGTFNFLLYQFQVLTKLQRKYIYYITFKVFTATSITAAARKKLINLFSLIPLLFSSR